MLENIAESYFVNFGDFYSGVRNRTCLLLCLNQAFSQIQHSRCGTVTESLIGYIVLGSVFSRRIQEKLLSQTVPNARIAIAVTERFEIQRMSSGTFKTGPIIKTVFYFILVSFLNFVEQLADASIFPTHEW